MIWRRKTDKYGLAQGVLEFKGLFQFVSLEDKSQKSGWFGVGERRIYERLPDTQFDERAEELIKSAQNVKKT